MPEQNLPAELYWLTLTILMTALMWLPYIFNRLREQGAGNALWDPQGKTATGIAWADRMMRAHQNAVENLIVFAPLVLALQQVGISTPLTVTACMIYFFTRAAHFVVFTLSVPVLRVPAFGIGAACQVTLALVLLGVIG